MLLLGGVKNCSSAAAADHPQTLFVDLSHGMKAAPMDPVFWCWS
jgi:hypothetical protein